MGNNFYSISTTHDRARVVSFITCLFALMYHFCVLILFLCLKIYPMALFNIASVTIFTTLMLLIPKMKNYIALYFIGMTEVIVHQIFADYFLGTYSSFHFFIFLMGLLPFLVFENEIKLAVPVTFITSIIFVVFESIEILPKYELSETMFTVIHDVNVSVTIIIIIFMISIYKFFSIQTENFLRYQNNRFEKELKLASHIQQNFFNQNNATIKDWDIGYINQPMASVSGDMYDIYRTNDNLEGFGIFDVSGHGISSGLVTMLVKNIIHQEFYKNTDCDIWETLLCINDRVTEEKGDIENYLTGILARIKNNEIEFVNASHPCPLLYKRETNKIEVIERPAKAMGAIGLKDFPTFYESQYIKLEKGDELLFFTDGVTDCLNEEKEEFGLEKLIESFSNVVGRSASQQVELLLNEINAFRGLKEANDDITFMIIKKQ